MSQTPQLGAKVRGLRRQLSLSQKQMAQRLSISASYLNLIEHGKRPLSAPVLIKLAQTFQIDLASFAEDGAQVQTELIEIFADPVFDNLGLTNADVRDLVAAHPTVAEAVRTLYRAYRDAREASQTAEVGGRTAAAGGIADLAQLPTEEVSDYLQRQQNHFPTLEEAAQRLRRDAGIQDDNRYQKMASWMEEAQGVRIQWVPVEASPTVVRRYDPHRRVLFLSHVLAPRSRHFQLAHQLGLLTAKDQLDELCDDRRLTTPDARSLARVALANYFAGAILMPYESFLDESERRRYDLELLGHRFRTSFEQVCHRVCTLRRPGAEGVPFHMIRVDIAGNISKRFSGSGIHFARYSGACPRWNVHAAFLTPSQLRTQTSVMEDGTVYFCVARTVQRGGGGWKQPHALHAIGLGCAQEHAPRVVYADGRDVGIAGQAGPVGAVAVGVSCRLCERPRCPQRAFPPLSQRLNVDENVRSINLFAPVRD